MGYKGDFLPVREGVASDYVTIEDALSSPAVATDWRAQKDVNSALAALVLSARS